MRSRTRAYFRTGHLDHLYSCADSSRVKPPSSHLPVYCPYHLPIAVSQTQKRILNGIWHWRNNTPIIINITIGWRIQPSKPGGYARANARCLDVLSMDLYPWAKSANTQIHVRVHMHCRMDLNLDREHWCKGDTLTLNDTNKGCILH